MIPLQHLSRKLFQRTVIFGSKIQQRDRGTATLCLVTLHSFQNTEKVVLLLCFSLLLYDEVMKSLFLVNMIPLRRSWTDTGQTFRG